MAYTYLELALKINREISDFHGTATTLFEMARQWPKDKEGDERMQFLEEALAISEQHQLDLAESILAELSSIPRRK